MAAPPSAASWDLGVAVLDGTTLGEAGLVPSDRRGRSRRVIRANVGKTVGDLLDTLALHKILSLPVLGGEGELVGFVDVGTVIENLVMDIVNAEKRDSAVADNMLAAVRELEGVGPIFTSRTLADLFTGGGGASRMWSAGGALSADEAPGITLSSFIRGGRLRGYTPAGGDGSFPRVVVVRELQPLRVVSQMDVARYLAGRKAELPILRLTLIELGLAFKPVVSVPETCVTVEALAAMYENDVRAVAITSCASGAIIGHLSGSDLRGMTGSDFGMLGLPVAEFLAIRHLVSWSSSLPHDPAVKSDPTLEELAPFCVVADTTLGTALELMTRQRIHQVWVVEMKKGRAPLGVVTLTDALRAVEEIRRPPLHPAGDDVRSTLATEHGESSGVESGMEGVSPIATAATATAPSAAAAGSCSAAPTGAGWSEAASSARPRGKGSCKQSPH